MSRARTKYDHCTPMTIVQCSVLTCAAHTDKILALQLDQCYAADHMHVIFLPGRPHAALDWHLPAGMISVVNYA